MHVVLVVPGGVDRSGTERVIPALLWLIEQLASRHRVTVVVLGQEPVATRYELLGATVVNVPPEAHGPHRLVRQLGRAVRAVGSEGRPDVVHGFWASVSGLAAVLAARRYRVPSLVHVAGGELVAMPELGYGGALGRGGRLISAQALRRADTVTTASHWLAEQVRVAGFRVDDVVALGVDTTVFSPAEDAPRAPRLIHVASRNRIKDQPTLLAAVARARRDVPELTLDVFGVDTLDGAIERLAGELGLDRAVTFHGFVPSAALAEHYRHAAINVITSRHEAGPLAVLEAAACAVPTVGTRVGHIADLAGLDLPAAVAVPIGDADVLGAALVDLWHDRHRRLALGQAALAWARRHDAAATAATFDDHYRRLRARS